MGSLWHNMSTPKWQRFANVQMRGVAVCSGANIQQKQHEMRMISLLGTIQPKELNINFSFILNSDLHLAHSTFYMHMHFILCLMTTAQCNSFLNTEEGLYSQLPLNRHLYKTDTQSWSLPFFTHCSWLFIRWTSLLNGHLGLVPKVYTVHWNICFVSLVIYCLLHDTFLFHYLVHSDHAMFQITGSS